MSALLHSFHRSCVCAVKVEEEDLDCEKNSLKQKSVSLHMFLGRTLPVWIFSSFYPQNPKEINSYMWLMFGHTLYFLWILNFPIVLWAMGCVLYNLQPCSWKHTKNEKKDVSKLLQQCLLQHAEVVEILFFSNTQELMRKPDRCFNNTLPSKQSWYGLLERQLSSY